MENVNFIVIKLEALFRTLNDRKICIIEDPQLHSNYGIFRSLPLLLEIIKPIKPILVSSYKNIEPMLKLPNFEIEHSHYLTLKEKDVDFLFIYSLSYHESTQMIVTRCLSYPHPKVIVVDTANFQTISGKNLSALLALIPIKYVDLWTEFWKNKPPIENTLNYAFHKLALQIGFKGKLEQMFDVKYIHCEAVWSWLTYLFDELKNEEEWRRLLRYWLEDEKVIENIVYNIELVRKFIG